MNYINKSNILHNYVQKMTFWWLVLSLELSTCRSVNMFPIYDKGEQNVSNHTYQQKHIRISYFSDFICDLIDTLYHPFPSHTNSGTLVSRRTGSCCHHSRRTRTACIPLSECGSTTAERILNRPPLTGAPGSGRLQKLRGVKIITATSFLLDHVFHTLIMKHVKIAQKATPGDIRIYLTRSHNLDHKNLLYHLDKYLCKWNMCFVRAE